MPAHAQAKAGATHKPIKVFVKAIRYGKDDLALRQVDGNAQAEFLLGEDWKQGTKAQQKEFIELFHVVFSASAFPKLKDNLQKIETIVYATPKIQGKTAKQGSTLVIQHALKKDEIELKYDLVKQGKRWKLVDVTFPGDKSLLTNLRDDQIQPLYEDGGWDNLLDVMRKRVASLR